VFDVVVIATADVCSNAVSKISVLPNDIRTHTQNLPGGQPTKITFGATVTTALAAGDNITCLAHYENGVGIFAKPGGQSSSASYTVTVESGAPGCSATATNTGHDAATTTATHLNIVLADASGGTCAISGAFSMSISTDIAPNGAPESAVKVKMITSKDTFSPGYIIGYTVTTAASTSALTTSAPTAAPTSAPTTSYYSRSC
jgi:hypothetical protein